MLGASRLVCSQKWSAKWAASGFACLIGRGSSTSKGRRNFAANRKVLGGALLSRKKMYIKFEYFSGSLGDPAQLLYCSF